jgi:TNF receptor-associated factor 4
MGKEKKRGRRYERSLWCIDKLRFCCLAGDRDIKALKVRCCNLANGCTWTGEVLSAEKHSSKCGYRQIICPNMCTTAAGKQVHIMQKDVKTHLASECERRLFACPHCKERGEYRIITNAHLLTCPQYKIACSNDSCREMVKRTDMPKHKLECPHEKVGCKYEVVGCKTSLKRREMEKHENTDPTHLLLAMEAVLKQQERVKCLEGQLARVSSYNKGKFTFKMAAFSQLKLTGALFFSPSFYTGPGGYKMCIRVVANGDGQGKDTHISVYAVVMRGDYDDNLEWPIKGTVIVELLNHLRDDTHHAIRFSYPEGRGDVSTQRVTTGDRAKRGYGKTRFIPYTELGLNKQKNCQYLKDDGLYFRITVETVNPKPWLSCSI